MPPKQQLLSKFFPTKPRKLPDSFSSSSTTNCSNNSSTDDTIDLTKDADPATIVRAHLHENSTSSTSNTTTATAKPKSKFITVEKMKRKVPEHWDHVPTNEKDENLLSAIFSATNTRAAKQPKKIMLRHIDVDEDTVPKLTGQVDTKKESKPEKIALSEQQQRAIDLAITYRQNLFFTGPAGTGKTFLLRELISQLRKLFHRNPASVAITASTGIAACNVGGTTIHSFAGIGIGEGEADALVRRIEKFKPTCMRWLETKVLIIDEISMLDGDLFDKLEYVARKIRKNDRPFGGIQVILCGDFFQLPPVSNGKNVKPFCFEAKQWPLIIGDNVIQLTQVFRQKEETFVKILNELRVNRLQPDSIRKLQSLDRPLSFDDGIEATELYPTRAQVDAANSKRLETLSGDVKEYEAEDWVRNNDEFLRKRLESSCLAPVRVSFKVNSQVMLIKNKEQDKGLVNGALGIIIGFEEMENGEELPIVRFPRINSPKEYITMVVQREDWIIEENGMTIASRTQIPLILAWSMSVHKSQGMTIPRVRVDLKKVFEKGQAYVALSRATCLEGLQVIGFDPRKVMAHPKVIGKRMYHIMIQRRRISSRNRGRGRGSLN